MDYQNRLSESIIALHLHAVLGTLRTLMTNSRYDLLDKKISSDVYAQEHASTIESESTNCRLPRPRAKTKQMMELWLGRVGVQQIEELCMHPEQSS